MPRRRPPRPPRPNDLTHRFLSGDFDDESPSTEHRYTDRAHDPQQARLERTALLRAAEEEITPDVQNLPIGDVVQVFSLFSQVEHPSGPRLCVMRKTLNQLADTTLVVGD